jgi:hypothetical protein
MTRLINALLITLILGTSFSAYATLPQERIESLQTYLPVELNAEISWKKCGDWNGFYWFDSGAIELCEENLALPEGAARMIFLHALGHAYTIPKGSRPKDADFLRWNGNYEDAADEFAMIMTLVQGRPYDLIDMARVREKWAKENPPIVGDEHSPAIERARRLRAMYWGFVMQFGPGFETYKEALGYWKGRFLATERSRGNL